MDELEERYALSVLQIALLKGYDRIDRITVHPEKATSARDRKEDRKEKELEQDLLVASFFLTFDSNIQKLASRPFFNAGREKDELGTKRRELERSHPFIAKVIRKYILERDLEIIKKNLIGLQTTHDKTYKQYLDAKAALDAMLLEKNRIEKKLFPKQQSDNIDNE